MDLPLAPLLNNCILESGSLALNADCPRLKWTLGLASMLSDCYRPIADLPHMSRHILYAYVDCADLEDISEPLLRRFHAFASEGLWVMHAPTVINRREDAKTQGGDLPLWEMGVNVLLPDPGAEPIGWFGDIERIARFACGLNVEFQREFVLGIHNAVTRTSEDLFFINEAKPDLEALRRIIGTEPPSAR